LKCNRRVCPAPVSVNIWPGLVSTAANPINAMKQPGPWDNTNVHCGYLPFKFTNPQLIVGNEHEY